MNPIPTGGWVHGLPGPPWPKPCSGAQWGAGVLAARRLDGGPDPSIGLAVDEFVAGIAPDGAGGAFIIANCVNLGGLLNQGPFTLCHLDQFGHRTASVALSDPFVSPGFAASAIVPSGPGRCITLWSGDHRRSGLLAQCYDVSGLALWMPDPVIASPYAAVGLQGTYVNAGSNLIAEPDGSGGAIVAWFLGITVAGSYDAAPINAQRITAGGQVLWGTNGALAGQAKPGLAPNWAWKQLVPDGGGGAIVLWSESVPGLGRRTDTAYVAVALDATGTISNGPTTVVTTRVNDWIADRRLRRAVSDGAGGLFLAFTQTGGDLHCLRYRPGAGVLWDLSFGRPIATRAFSIREDGAGGCILTFLSAGPWPMLEMKRLDPAGNVTWDINAPGSTPIQIQIPVGSSSWPPAYWADLVQAMPNGAGGAMLVYQDWPNARPSPKLFSICFNAQGVAVSPAQPVSARTGGQEYPMVTTGGGSNAIMAWADDVDSAMFGLDVWAQRLGCCPIPQSGEWPAPPFPCELLDFPGSPYKQLTVTFPCGDRDRQVGILPLSRLSTLVRGLDCPGCLTNRDAPVPDWMRINLLGLPDEIEVQLQKPNGRVVKTFSVIDGPEGSALARSLTFEPSAKDELVIVFIHHGGLAPRARFDIRIETAWGSSVPASLAPPGGQRATPR